MKKLSVVGVAIVASVLCATPISLRWSPDTTSVLSVDRAEARIGRPLTPMSVAGVNRRVHRRAYRRSYYYGSYAHQLY
jgi:hypothetical protein